MVTRRAFLQGAAVVGAGLLIPGLTGCDPEAGPFTHSVASGDPDPTSVVLWTRVNPSGRSGSVAVRYQVSTTSSFGSIVAQGSFTTSAARDWTVKVIAQGLLPGRTYYYRFIDDGAPGGAATSPTGRTKTAPSGPADRLRFGVVSCSNYAHGFFHAYRHLLARDLDAVIHLGDYIYEYASKDNGNTYGEARELRPLNEIVSLTDYRLRYAQYRSDPDLRELHRLHPMIHIWDDHEFANDPAIGGAQNHQSGEGSWSARVAAALQAYTEWMPTRISGNRIYRTLDYGSLARIAVVDRQRRFLWPEAADGDLYLGAEQAQWLDARINETTSTWCLLAQGTTFGAPFILNTVPFPTGWNARDRNRVIDAVGGRPSDLVVLTGDIHNFQALEVIRDATRYRVGTGTGSGGVEFAAGSVTSPGVGAILPGPQMRWSDGGNRGYCVLTLRPSVAQCDFWGFPDSAKTSTTLPSESWLRGFTTAKGSKFLVQASSPAS